MIKNCFAHIIIGPGQKHFRNYVIFVNHRILKYMYTDVISTVYWQTLHNRTLYFNQPAGRLCYLGSTKGYTKASTRLYPFTSCLQVHLYYLPLPAKLGCQHVFIFAIYFNKLELMLNSIFTQSLHFMVYYWYCIIMVINNIFSFPKNLVFLNDKKIRWLWWISTKLLGVKIYRP